MAFNISYIFQVIDGFSKNIRKFQVGMRNLRRTTDVAANKIRNNFKGIQNAAGKAAAKLRGMAIAATGFLLLAGKQLLEFEMAMNRIKAVTKDISTKELRQLREEARRLGSVTEKTAVNAAEGMVSLAKSGLKAKQILELIPSVLALSTTGGIEVAEAATALSKIVQGFNFEGIKAANVVDILAKASNSANTNLQELSDSIRKAVPGAKVFDVSLTKVAAAMAVFIEGGQQGLRAGTAFKTLMTKLAGPLSKDARKRLREIGITLKDFNKFKANKDMFGFFELIGERAKKLNLSKDKIATLIESLVGLEAIASGLDLVFESKKIKDFSNSLLQVDGVARKMQKDLLEGLPGAVLKLLSVFGELIQQLGAAGLTAAIISVSNFLNDLITGFNKSGPFIKQFTIFILILIPVLAALIVPLATIVTSIGLLTLVFKSFFGIGSAFAILFIGISSGFLLVVGGIIRFITHWDELKKAFSEGGFLKAWDEFFAGFGSIAFGVLAVGILKVLGVLKGLSVLLLPLGAGIGLITVGVLALVVALHRVITARKEIAESFKERGFFGGVGAFFGTDLEEKLKLNKAETKKLLRNLKEREANKLIGTQNNPLTRQANSAPGTATINGNINIKTDSGSRVTSSDLELLGNPGNLGFNIASPARP